MRFSIIILLFLPLTTETAEKFFKDGNAAFARGEYENAIKEYRNILDTNRTSAAIHHNLANAYFEFGRTQHNDLPGDSIGLGRAIYHYRIAKRLDPRDRINRAHLKQAREYVHGQTPRESVLRVFTGYLTVNEWTIAASLCLTAGLSLLSVSHAYRPWRGRWTLPICLLLTSGAGISVMAIIKWQHQTSGDEAVTVREVKIYKRPLASEDVPDQVSHEDTDPIGDGIELRIVDRLDDKWLKVAFEEGALKRKGWVQLGSDTQPNVLIFPN